jgi:Glycosyltransferase family 87
MAVTEVIREELVRNGCYNPRPMSATRALKSAAIFLMVFAFAAYLIMTFPHSPKDTTRLLDFSEFYAAAEIVRHGLGSRLYDLLLQSEYQLRVAPVHAFFLRPPFEAVLFIPFTYVSYRTAYAVWTVICLGILAITAHLIRNNTDVLKAMTIYAHGVQADFGLLYIVLLTFAPTMNCLLIGQDSVLILFIYTLVFISLRDGHESRAGALAACGLFKFHLVLPFVFIFVLRRRSRFLIGFAAVALVLVFVSVLACGFGILISYPKLFLTSQYKSLLGFQPEYAANIRGLVYLLSFGRLPGAITGGLVALSSVYILWVVAKAWRDDQLVFSFSASVVATLLTGFHAFIYDMALLLLPVAIVCSALVRNNALLRHRGLSLILLILFIPPVHFVLAQLHAYALMGIVLIGLFISIVQLMNHGRDHMLATATV